MVTYQEGKQKKNAALAIQPILARVEFTTIQKVFSIDPTNIYKHPSLISLTFHIPASYYRPECNV